MDERRLALSLELLLEDERKAGRLRSERVRCFVKYVRPVEWVDDQTHEDGGYYVDTDESPLPVIVAQAYSYRWGGDGMPTGTYAGQMEMAPQLVERAPMDTFLPGVVADLQREHDRHGFSA